MAIEIRPRRDDDLETLAKVLVEVHERDGYPVEGVADPRAWLVSDRLIGAWVATLDGVPMGQVMLTIPGDGDAAPKMWASSVGASPHEGAVLGRLFISARARGHRLGERLIQEAVREARSIGRHAVLDVMAKDAAAITTYERLGWRRLGEVDHQLSDGTSIAAYAYAAPKGNEDAAG